MAVYAGCLTQEGTVIRNTNEHGCDRKALVALFSLLLSVAPCVSYAQNQNPAQVAILHWYGANQTTSFPVTSPWPIVFDGANMWVGNYSGGGITKFRANDGTNLGTFSS